MKEREEYFWELQGRLFDALGDTYRGIDRSLIVSYGLSFSLLLFDWSGSTEFSFLGAKLKMNEQQVLSYLPLVIVFLYTLVAYKLHRLTGVYTAIREGAAELRAQNDDARPLEMSDTRHFECGTAGLIISIARWQIDNLFHKNPFTAFRVRGNESTGAFLWRMFRFSWKASRWIPSVIWRVPAILALYLVPILIVGAQLRSQIYLPLSNSTDFATLIIFVFVVVAGLVTAAHAARLFATYFLDVLDALRGDMKVGPKCVADYILEKARLRSANKPVPDFPEGYHQKFWSFMAHFPKAKREFIANDFDWTQLDDELRIVCEKSDSLARLPS